MNQEILDHTLHSYLHKIISKLPLGQAMQLKTLASCGSKIVPRKGLASNVYLISNGEHSKFIGQTMCKNTWACPVCSAYMMSKYSSEIASAIEMKRAEGYIAFMVTFSVPHLRFMKCRDVTDILFKTFEYFRRTAKQKNYRKRSNGELGNRTGTVSKQFFEELDITDYVNVCEYTWGVNGWHPHFHMLMWTKKENADSVMKWQEKLNEFWLKTAKRVTQKHLEKFYGEKYTQTVIRLYDRAEKDAGVFISNDNGKLRESLTSDYVAGWGADKELTGNRRKEASHNGHFTPYQILEKAYYGDKDMEDLYIEFCLQVTRKPVHHRVTWSKNGFKSRITQFRQTEKARDLLKKKESAEMDWYVLCYFTPEQWKEICYFDKFTPLRGNLLFMATFAPDLIPKYLENFDIFLNPYNDTCRQVAEIINIAV